MTSVFFRDVIVDLPVDAPRAYTESYYEQYPALGLLIWPPLFHGLTGILMSVLGTSILIPRLFVFCTFIVSLLSVYRLSCRRTSADRAFLVTALYSVLPMVFLYSRHVMLEMPTLALCLLCIDFFDLWLRRERHRFLYLAAVFAAAAALTRFDAILLLPALLLTAIFEGQTRRLFNRHVLAAAAIALIIVGPTYLVIWREMGELHVRQAVESVGGEEGGMLQFSSLFYYPSSLAEQGGWAVALLVGMGLPVSFTAPYRRSSGLYAALLVGTYICFTPLAELQPRHAIYWLPAIAWFAVMGAERVFCLLRRTNTPGLFYRSILPSALLLAATVSTSLASHVFHVRGYELAAQTVLNNTSAGDRIFVDAWWDGNLIYHLRHLDKSRSRFVIRADQSLFDFTCVPTVDFTQQVNSDMEILEVIRKSESTMIAFEDPQPFGEIDLSRQMRALVHSQPQLFPLVQCIPVHSTVPNARNVSLYIFDVDAEQLQSYLNQSNPGIIFDRPQSDAPLKATQ